ncbi:MAG: carbohydrate-binding family 9-like protein [Deltaproteobacteria bacterium]|nr:carbohydrate-binding family 9-like protein [Deltaproteobacteria bacterium]
MSGGILVRSGRSTKAKWVGATVALALAAMVGGCVQRAHKSSGHRRRQLTPADWKVIRQNLLKKAPEHLTYSVNAHLGDKAIFLGADVKGPVAPGKPFHVISYWKALKPMPGWRMFSHLNGPGGSSSFVNVDHAAIGGRYYVDLWKPGQIIRDDQAITLPANWAYKTVELYVGIWKPSKGRLKVTSGASDGHDRVLVAKIPIGQAVSGTARSESKPPRRYVVRKATGPIVLDGKAREADWQKAPFTELFVNSMNGSAMPLKTRAKMLWDDKNLYVFFDCEDPDVWAAIKKHDGALWTQEMVELMIDADGNGATYIELQANAAGAIFDSYLPRYRQNQNDWESGMKVAVSVQGTLNKKGDKDKGWTVELALPLTSVVGRSKAKVAIPPKSGTTWRANMFRMDVPKGRARMAMAWSPPLKGDFHVLNRFGALVFADANGKTGPVLPRATPASSTKSSKSAQSTGPAHPARVAVPRGAKKIGGAHARHSKTMRPAQPRAR